MLTPLLSPDEWQAVRLSMLVASAAVVVSLPFGVAVAWLLARREFVGKTAVETLINLPLVLPPVVTGYVLLIALGRHGWIGRFLDNWFGVRLVFTWQGAAIASAVMAFPLMVNAIRLAFTGVDPRLESAARTLGAGRWDAFFSVSVPLARHGIIAGAVLAFARGMGEFGATIMIAGSIPGETRTIPLQIYEIIQSPDGVDHAVPLVVVSIALSAGALMIGAWFDRRGRRRLNSI